MSNKTLIEEELEHLQNLSPISTNEQVIDDFFGGKNFVRIPKFFIATGTLTKIELSLDRDHVRNTPEIVFAFDKGLLVAFIPENATPKPKYKTPSEVFFDAYNN